MRNLKKIFLINQIEIQRCLFKLSHQTLCRKKRILIFFSIFTEFFHQMFANKYFSEKLKKRIIITNIV